MADESQRKTRMLRIKNPDDGSQYVDVKVIDQIDFTDPKTNAQEYIFRFNNHPGGNRKVHVHRVISSSGGGGGGDGEEPHSGGGPGHLDVERVDEFTVVDPKTNAQEFTYRMTGNASEPPQHAKTHDVKVHSKANSNIWVKIQRIDELTLTDPKDNAQERTFRLQWPDDDETNPSTLDTSDNGTEINPPWRLDPFQNIVDVQWKKKKPDPPKSYDRFQVIAHELTRITSRFGDGIVNVLPGFGGTPWIFFSDTFYFTTANHPLLALAPHGYVPQVRPYPGSAPPVGYWMVLAEFTSKDNPNASSRPFMPQPFPAGGTGGWGSLPFGPLFYYEDGETGVDTGCSGFSFGGLIGFDKDILGTTRILRTNLNVIPPSIIGGAADASAVASLGGQGSMSEGNYTYYYITDPANPAVANYICVATAPTITFFANLGTNFVPADQP